MSFLTTAIGKLNLDRQRLQWGPIADVLLRGGNRPSRSRWKRIAQICFCVSGRFVPTFLTALQAALSGMAETYLEYPIFFLRGPNWPSPIKMPLDEQSSRNVSRDT